MSLTVSSGARGCIDLTESSRPPFSTSRLINPYPSRRTNLHIISASKKPTSQTGRFDSKKRRTLVPTTTKDEPQEEQNNSLYDGLKPPSQLEIDGGGDRFAVNTRFRGEPEQAPKYYIKDLPGLEPDPFEGPQFDGLGFFVQYLWAFGILFALVSGGIAAGTYNEGATDFKETPVYKEAIQSRDLLDEAESSSSEDVFESNPTDVAPSVE